MANLPCRFGLGADDTLLIPGVAYPTVAVADPGLLRGWVAWAREGGAILAADECYLEFDWGAEPMSVLHPQVCGDSHDNLLAALAVQALQLRRLSGRSSRDDIITVLGEPHAAGPTERWVRFERAKDLFWHVEFDDMGVARRWSVLGRAPGS